MSGKAGKSKGSSKTIDQDLRKRADAKNADPQDQLKVAQLAFEGENSPVEPEVALKYFLKVENNPKSTKEQKALAKRYLGQCYTNIENIKGFKIDKQKAFEYYQASFDLNPNKLETRFFLARCYLYSEGVEENIEKAIELLKPAETAQQPPSLALLGLCYLKTQGTSRNLIKGFNLLRTSVENGAIWEALELAECYRLGLGTKPNPEFAFKWVKVAANDQKFLLAQKKLGEYYRLGIGTPVSLEHSFAAYKIAAEEGDGNALLRVGECLLFGIGTKQDDKNAYLYFKKALEKNEPLANYFIGYCCYEGFGVKKNAKTAVEYFKKSLQLNPEHAITPYYLAVCYLSEEEVELNPVEAVRLLEIAANKPHNFAAAMNLLGDCLKEGLGVEKDLIRSFTLYKGAAAQQCKEAFVNLSTCYREGIGTEVNHFMAFHTMKRAVELGSAEAQLQLALYYGQGIGVALDSVQSLTWLQKAAEFKQNAIALLLVGKAFLYGTGTAIKLESAYTYFERGLKAGIPEARAYLGWCCVKGLGVKKSKEARARGIAYLKECVSENSVFAQTKLGLCYFHGWGVTKDLKQAAALFKKAEAGEDPEGTSSLGVCYLEGIEVAIDRKKAFALFSKAAQKGDNSGRNNLALCYWHGWGTTQNYEAAFKEFLVCSNAGNEIATFFLANCYLNGYGTSVNQKEAVRLYAKLSATEDPKSQSMLGLCHFNGWGVEKSLALAVKEFNKATTKKHVESTNCLAICLLMGYGIAKDTMRAVKHLESIKDVNSDALNNLGWYYLTLGPEHYKTALEHFRKAAEKGNFVAENNIGWCLLNGFGTERSQSQAEEYFKILAAKRGAHKSNHEGFGLSCSYGLGVLTSFDLDQMFLPNISERAICEIQHNLAFCYARGYGVGENVDMATKYSVLSVKSIIKIEGDMKKAEEKRAQEEVRKAEALRIEQEVIARKAREAAEEKRVRGEILERLENEKTAAAIAEVERVKEKERKAREAAEAQRRAAEELKAQQEQERKALEAKKARELEAARAAEALRKEEERKKLEEQKKLAEKEKEAQRIAAARRAAEEKIAQEKQDQLKEVKRREEERKGQVEIERLKVNDKAITACEAVYLQAQTFLELGNAFPAAYSRFIEALGDAQKLGATLLEGKCHVGLANYFKLTAEFKKSKDDLLGCLKMYEKSLEHNKAAQIKLLEVLDPNSAVAPLIEELKQTQIRLEAEVTNEMQSQSKEIQLFKELATSSEQEQAFRSAFNYHQKLTQYWSVFAILKIQISLRKAQDSTNGINCLIEAHKHLGKMVSAIDSGFKEGANKPELLRIAQKTSFELKSVMGKLALMMTSDKLALQTLEGLQKVGETLGVKIAELLDCNKISVKP